MTERRCRHCNKPIRKRPRGLCWRCYVDSNIRYLYPGIPQRERNSGRRGVGLVKSMSIPKPTNVPPGPDKVDVLADRASRGECLFHEDDAKITDE